MVTTQATRTRHKHAQGQMLVTRRRPRKDTQWGYRKKTRHAYGRNDKR